MSVNFQLVKMDGDWVPRPKWWQLPTRVSNWWHKRNVMPVDPKGHPSCAEIIEGADDRAARITYRRD
jgi:hypothetical protein